MGATTLFVLNIGTAIVAVVNMVQIVLFWRAKERYRQAARVMIWLATEQRFQDQATPTLHWMDTIITQQLLESRAKASP